MGKWKYHIIITIVIAIFAFIFVSGKLKKNDMRLNGITVNVKITEFVSAKNGKNPNFKCEFTYKGIKKELFSSSNVSNNFNDYVGEMFPAMYSVKYDVLQVLMTEEDFKEFKMKYPDSLLNRSYSFPH